MIDNRRGVIRVGHRHNPSFELSQFRIYSFPVWAREMFAAPHVYQQFNRDAINQAALVHLRRLRISPESNALHVIDLAMWGLEHDHVAVPWNRYELELAVGQILDTDPKVL